MANIKKCTGKSGISYNITVTAGRNATGKQLRHYKTYTPPATWSEARAEKEAQKVAIQFEDEIKKGYDLDNRQTFEEYSAYVLQLKRRSGVRESTLDLYSDLLKRINPEIGCLKLVDIRPAHLNNLYSNLSKHGQRNTQPYARSKVDVKAALRGKKITQAALSASSGLAINTIAKASHGATVSLHTAEKISDALGGKVEKYFIIERDSSPLSDKTVLEHHRLISTILSQAEKEMLVPYNAAFKATPPAPKRKNPNYFQPEEVFDILDAVEIEPLKYKLFINLLAVTGCRRGEIAGLKWSKINLETGKLTIDCGLYYSPKRGVYEGDTKTGEHRILSVPTETITLLKQYRLEQVQIRFKNCDRWHETDYVFTRDNGEPTTPDTWTQWLDKFSKRHDLPHINPHAFRHTVASVLISKGVDINTVSGILGHSSVATTEDYYSHMIEEAKAAASETLTDVLIRRRA